MGDCPLERSKFLAGSVVLFSKTSCGRFESAKERQIELII